MPDGKIEYEVRANTNKLDSDLNEANSKAEKGSSKLGGIAKGVGLAVGGAFVAAGGAAIKFGSEFETSMARVSTLFGDVNVDTYNLNKKMLEMSNATGVAANELGAGLELALSSGIEATTDMGTALGFLEKNTKLAKAGFTDIDTAVDATTSIMNAYKMKVEDTERVHTILLQAQNLGKTTVDELAHSIAQVTPTAAAAGVSFEEVGAALATMTAQGTPTAQATTQLNAAISAFLKPNSEMCNGLKSTVTEMINNGEITGENAKLYIKYQDSLKKAVDQAKSFDTSTKEGAKAAKENEKTIKDLEKGIEDLTAEFGLDVLESKGLAGALQELSDNTDGSANKMALALGSSEALKAHKDCRNTNSIGIEMCCKKDKNGKWYIEAETVKKTIQAVKELMVKYKIPASNVLRHYDVTGKICPEPFVRDASQWNNFKSQLAAAAPEPAKPDATTTPPAAPVTTDTVAKTNSVKVSGKTSYIRAGAYVGANVLKTLAVGTSLTWLSDDDWGWSKVTDGKVTGYIQNSRISGKTGLSTWRLATNSGAGVNIRTSASTNSAVIKKIDKGATFPVICILPSGWIITNIDGVDRYVYFDKSYISIGGRRVK